MQPSRQLFNYNALNEICQASVMKYRISLTRYKLVLIISFDQHIIDIVTNLIDFHREQAIANSLVQLLFQVVPWLQAMAYS